MENKLVFCI